MVAECRCLFQAACAVTYTSKEKEIRNDPPGRGVGGPPRRRIPAFNVLNLSSGSPPSTTYPPLTIAGSGCGGVEWSRPWAISCYARDWGRPTGSRHGDAPPTRTVAAAAAVAPEAALDPSPAAAASDADGASSASSYDGIRTLVASSLASISSPTTRGALSRIADGLIDFMKGSLLPAPPSAAALCSPPPPRPVPALLAVV